MTEEKKTNCMVKNLLQDILPNEKKMPRRPAPLSADSVDPASPEKKNSFFEPKPRAPAEPSEEDTVIRYRAPELHTIDYDHPRRFKWQLWVPVIIAVALLVYSSTYFLSGATVTVTEKRQIVAANLDLRAVKVPIADELGFQAIPLIREGEKVVVADGQKQSDTKASGTIVIYNNWSTRSQRLITNTRFQTPTGLIYRIRSSLIVPGKTTIAGKSVPGSIEAVVYADASGKEYNVGLTDFTVPGFKSDAARYEGFYARSKTSMTGGFSGIAKVVNETTLSAARVAIRSELQAKLIAEVRREMPVGYILFDKAFTVSFEDEPNGDADPSGKSVTVRERATFTGFILNREAFTKTIAAKTLERYDGSPVTIKNLDTLLVAPVGALGGAELSTLHFTLKGDAVILWKFDEIKFAEDLSGKPKAEISTVLSGYPGILSAEVELRPFWKSVFPADPKKIIIQRKAGS